MSSTAISLMFTAGATAWIYVKFQRYSGNNTKAAVIASAIAAGMIFFVSYSILGFIIK